MKCPVCGAAQLIHTRDLPYTYKGETTVIPAVTADFYLWRWHQRFLAL